MYRLQKEEYEKIGVKEQDIKKIPKIDYDALCEFEMGLLKKVVLYIAFLPNM